MPVAAVAETVQVSNILEVFKSAFDEVPANVCNPVKVFATLVTGMFAPAKVDDPVPPLAIGSIPARTLDETFMKSEPFQATTAVSLAANVVPVVGPTPRILTVYVPDVLMTTYDFDWAGAVIVMFADAGEHKRMACLA